MKRYVAQETAVETVVLEMNQTIVVPSITANLSPLGFHHFGSDFVTAASAFPSTDRYSPLPYYLYCHAIELFLKAFLLTKGISRNELSKKAIFSHDLIKGLILARQNGLPTVIMLSAADEAELGKANIYYNEKGFEYFDVTEAMRGFSNRPDLSTLRTIAEKLQIKLKAVCEAAT